MAKRRADDEKAWKDAKAICRLTARQVEMARALGMNPKKLPGLRPSPQQRWKLPVGAFIVECYRKRFGKTTRDDGSTPTSRTHAVATRDADVSERRRDPAWQVSDLVCYLVNLADDLQAWLAHGSIDPEVLPRVREELGEIAKELETGAPISPMPAIPVPPQPARPAMSRRAHQRRAFDDEEIPF
jgi:hypothetical protein